MLKNEPQVAVIPSKLDIMSAPGTEIKKNLTTGPWGPGGPALSDVHVQALGRGGHLDSSL